MSYKSHSSLLVFLLGATSPAVLSIAAPSAHKSRARPAPHVTLLDQDVTPLCRTREAFDVAIAVPDA